MIPRNVIRKTRVVVVFYSDIDFLKSEPLREYNNNTLQTILPRLSFKILLLNSVLMRVTKFCGLKKKRHTCTRFALIILSIEKRINIVLMLVMMIVNYCFSEFVDFCVRLICWPIFLSIKLIITGVLYHRYDAILIEQLSRNFQKKNNNA